MITVKLFIVIFVQNFTQMAIAIRQIPVLTGKIASAFNKKAEKAVEKKHSIDFSAQTAAAKKILKKANL
jgi:hypothetical protein